jgi:hypothetical protein
MPRAGTANMEIRKAVKEANIFLWQVAEEYGLTDGNFSRLLRHEIPAEKKIYILAIINALKEEEL